MIQVAAWTHHLDQIPPRISVRRCRAPYRLDIQSTTVVNSASNRCSRAFVWGPVKEHRNTQGSGVLTKCGPILFPSQNQTNECTRKECSARSTNTHYTTQHSSPICRETCNGRETAAEEPRNCRNNEPETAESRRGEVREYLGRRT